MNVRTGKFSFKLFTILLVPFLSTRLLAQEPETDDVANGAEELLKPSRGAETKNLTESLIQTTKAFAEPRLRKNGVPAPIEVTTKSVEARAFARQGFGILQSKWDIEAHRCFVKALELDPACLPAYCGLLIQTKANHNLSSPYQDALISKVDELRKAKNGDDYKYSEQERLYAELSIAIIDEDIEEKTDIFIKFQKKYPADLSAHMFERAVLTANREKSMKYLNALMRRYRYSPLLWSTWVNVNLVNGDKLDAKMYEDKVLPVLDKIFRWEGDDVLPVWELRKGIILRRMNKLNEAEEAFNKASELFVRWGSENKIPKEYNDGFWKAQLFKVSTLYELGEFAQAIKLAKELQAIKINPLVQSEVRGIYLWEVQTLPTRLYIARGKEGDLELALKALPKVELLDSIQKESAAAMYCSGLFQYIAILSELKKGDIRKAQDFRDEITKTLTYFGSLITEYGDVFPDRIYLLRGRKALDAYAYHSHGLIEYRVNKNKESLDEALKIAKEYSKDRANTAELPQEVLSDWAQ